MTLACSHLDQVADVLPGSDGCEDCLRVDGRWGHLRICMSCGYVACCDSPNRHGPAQFHRTGDPIIQSFEPGEDWWYRYLDDIAASLGWRTVARSPMTPVRRRVTTSCRRASFTAEMRRRP